MIFLTSHNNNNNNNTNNRTAHKWGARCVLMFAWFTAFMGLNTLTQHPIALAMFAVPLMMIFPVTLM
jgi:hypothetical protein